MIDRWGGGGVKDIIGHLDNELKHSNDLKVFTCTLCSIEDVALSADAGKRSWNILAPGFIVRTNRFVLTLVHVVARQPIARVAQVTYALVSSGRPMAQAAVVAGGDAQRTGRRARVVGGGHRSVQTRAHVGAGRVDAFGEGGARGLGEAALVHILAREAIAFEARLARAAEAPDGVGAQGPRVARARLQTLVRVFAVGAVAFEAALAAAGVGPDGV